jgi:hypothetical protein
VGRGKSRGAGTILTPRRFGMDILAQAPLGRAARSGPQESSGAGRPSPKIRYSAVVRPPGCLTNQPA